MCRDLEYFAEFLENPSTPEINEFFRMVREWARYVEAHQHEFNYIEDDAWKDIRERLLDELEIRLEIKERLEAEWDELNASLESMQTHTDDEIAGQAFRRLDFMKKYQQVFGFTNEDLAEYERLATKYLQAIETSRKSDEAARLAKLELDDSIAALDDELVSYYERTGKIPALPTYGRKKNHKGN